MECRKGSEQEEKSVVTLANTGADPWAVMVVHLNACATITAVERAWWAQYVTRAALCDCDVLATYPGYVLYFVLFLPGSVSFILFIVRTTFSQTISTRIICIVSTWCCRVELILQIVFLV